MIDYQLVRGDGILFDRQGNFVRELTPGEIDVWRWLQSDAGRKAMRQAKSLSRRHLLTWPKRRTFQRYTMPSSR